MSKINKIKRAVYSFLWMYLIFVSLLLLIQFDKNFIFPVLCGVTAFFLLKIIYSNHFEYVFNKPRYALSLLRFIYLPLIPLRKYLGETKGNYFFSFLIPAAVSSINKDFFGVLFSFMGMVFFYFKITRTKNFVKENSAPGSSHP